MMLHPPIEATETLIDAVKLSNWHRQTEVSA
jgi:hypothetical protein